MDMSLIQGTITGLKTASDIAKGFLDLKNLSEVQGKVIELQAVILNTQSSAMAANSAQFAAVEEIRAIKEEVMSIKAWEAQKKRYKLVSPWQGTVLYALKESVSDSEPPHWICTHCYENGSKGFLNHKEESQSLFMVCAKCKNKIQTPWSGGSVELKYAEQIKNG